MTGRPESRRRDSFNALVNLAGWGYGYFTAKQAREAGNSWDTLKNHLRRGRIERVARGVYRLRSLPTDVHAQEREILLQAGIQSALSHESALALHNLSDIIPHKIHITLPRSARWHKFTDPVVQVHFVTRPLARNEVETVDGIRVTKPARTIVDCIDTHSAPEQMQMAIDQALARGIIRVADLWRLAEHRKSHVWRWLNEHLKESERLAVSKR